MLQRSGEPNLKLRAITSECCADNSRNAARHHLGTPRAIKSEHRARSPRNPQYAFVAEHRALFSVRAMCRCLRIQPSGFYAWVKNPLSRRAKEDARQTELLRQAWEDSGKVYGYRKLHDDLLDQGETCCPNRVARLASLAGIRARIGYKRRPGSYGGKPSRVVDNTLARQFDVAAPDKTWVTDITYIRTQEGFAYLAVVIDLYSRRVVGWSMQNRQTTDLVLQALKKLSTTALSWQLPRRLIECSRLWAFRKDAQSMLVNCDP